MADISKHLAALKNICTGTVTTILVNKGVRKTWMRGPMPTRAGLERKVGRAFTLRFVPAREDLATTASWGKPISTRAAIEQMDEGVVAVADAMGLKIDAIEKELLPLITDYEIDLPNRFLIAAGESAGVNQTYTAKVGGKPWFVSHFYGHVDLAGINKSAQDEIELSLDGKVFQTITLKPGIGSQVGSKNMVANSIQRILAAADGWVTVAHMEPAFPESL